MVNLVNRYTNDPVRATGMWKTNTASQQETGTHFLRNGVDEGLSSMALVLLVDIEWSSACESGTSVLLAFSMADNGFTSNTGKKNMKTFWTVRSCASWLACSRKVQPMYRRTVGPSTRTAKCVSIQCLCRTEVNKLVCPKFASITQREQSNILAEIYPNHHPCT